jgi:LysM repeat protein
MVVTKGETSMAITRRFGMSLEEILKINPGLSDPDALAVGSSLCIVPNWRTVMAGNGQRICVA